MGKSLITGIDIGHHSIKAVVLKPVGDTYTLVGFNEILVEPDVFSDNHTLNYQKIVKKLKELRKGLPLFSRKAAIAIPDNAVISKVLQIDSELEGREKEFAVFQAFSHQSPFPIEDLSLDYVEIDQPSVKRSNTSTYQVYATKKEVVESRTSAVTKAGFSPFLLDVQAHSLIHLWQLAAKAQNRSNWMMLDIGFSQSSLCIDFTDKAPFHKDIALGTQMIESNYSSSNAFLPNHTETFINALIERIQRQLQLYNSVNQGFPIMGIWLTGGGSTTPMLAESISNRTQLQCEVFNPFSLFEYKSSKRQSQRADGHCFSTAAGLALRGVSWLESSHVA